MQRISVPAAPPRYDRLLHARQTLQNLDQINNVQRCAGSKIIGLEGVRRWALSQRVQGLCDIRGCQIVSLLEARSLQTNRQVIREDLFDQFPHQQSALPWPEY